MELILYGFVMLVAMTLAGVIGFAANVLALPVLSMFLPLKTAVAVLMLIVAVQVIIQAIQVRHQVNWREVVQLVVVVVIGMPIGFLALNFLPEQFMKGVLGLFVAATAIKGLLDDVRGKKSETFQERPWHKLLLFFSGLLTGAFGCGGPLMVVYCRNRYRDKDTFRVMQFASGSIIMTLPCLAYAWSGAYTMAGVPYIIIGFLAVAVALRVSAKIARHLNTSAFQKLVNVVLLISAVMLIWQTIGV